MVRLALGIFLALAWIVAYGKETLLDWWTHNSPRERLADVLQVIGVAVLVLLTLFL